MDCDLYEIGAKSFTAIVILAALAIASNVQGAPIAAEKRYDLDNLVHDTTTLVTRPQAIITGNHDHALHGRLIDCGIAGIFDSRTTAELQKAYDDAGCKNKLGPLQLLGNLQNQIAVLPGKDGKNHSFGRLDLLGNKKHPYDESAKN
ncbi:hypothetical protein BGW38_010038 [Lunasporangiospora selenospora]|uniref:Uncharacterized protein n=1 Tax=Lunasporangiospora selenospora TaxID=979761 RepID=A0A9P6FX17_9FUNG|nr:hypothetical protein BGW38_010038 [Lunasporangiospora selenospora]